MNENTIELVIKAVDKATDVIGGVINKVSSSFDNVGEKLLKTGAVLGLAVAPFVGALGNATAEAQTFQESMTNVQALLGASAADTAKLSDEILKIGANAREGPQAAADAFSDIVGGVSDASTHMAILEAAIATSEAGAAELAGTTSALISVMNSYGYSADKATRVSDVLTRTVGMGVGTMDEFAAALPSVTGLANSMGISFEELAGSMAFLTTKGFSASESATQLRASMTALMNPNAVMLKAFKELGVANGELLVKQYGLVGALEMVSKTNVASQDGLAKTLGSVEALNGVLALTGDGATEFSDQFVSGIDGATAAAQKIQLDSVAAQMDLLNSSVSALKIEVGSALLPVINDLLKRVRPIITAVTGWASKNTKLIATVAKVVSLVAGLAAGLTAAGAAFTAIGAIMGSALFPVIAIIGALYAAWKTNFGGIRDIVNNVIDIIRNDLMSEIRAIWTALKGGDISGVLSSIGSLFAAIVTIVTGGGTETRQGLESTIGQIPAIFDQVKTTILSAFATVSAFIRTNVLPVFALLVSWLAGSFVPAVAKVITGSVLPLFKSLFSFLASAWKIVSPALTDLFQWFVNKGLPDILKFISKTVIPGIGSLIDTVRAIFDATAPYLLKFLDWFVNTGMPAVIRFIRNTVIPGIQAFIQKVVDIWTIVQPWLQRLYTWFVGNGLPAIKNYIYNTMIPALVKVWQTIRDVWSFAYPYLLKLYNWFTVSAFPGIKNFIYNTFLPAFYTVQNTLKGIWDAISPKLQAMYTWFTNSGLPWIKTAINDLKTAGDNLANGLYGIWDRVYPKFVDMYNWINDKFTWLKNNVIGPLIDKIQSAIDIYNRAKGLLGSLNPGNLFQTGGFTGAGPLNQIAGVVHRQEYVIPAHGAPVMLPGALTDAISRMASMLNAMAARPALTPATVPAGGGGNVYNNQQYTIPITVTVDAETARANPNAGRDIADQIRAALTAQGGGVSIG